MVHSNAWQQEPTVQARWTAFRKLIVLPAEPVWDSNTRNLTPTKAQKVRPYRYPKKPKA